MQKQNPATPGDTPQRVLPGDRQARYLSISTGCPADAEKAKIEISYRSVNVAD
jgi:hypothetical protein